MFRAIFLIQAGALLIFLPPIMCGALTREKENRTLGLLILTDLTPNEIVLQKFLSRIVPMITFLLLALPLMALPYSFGGFTLGDLVTRATFLFTTALLVGSVSIMFSAYCSTLLSALLGTYAFLLLFPPVPLAALLPFLVDEMMESAPEARFITTFLLPAPSVVLSIGFLGLARYFVVRRALVRPGNVTRQVQKQVDGLWKRLSPDSPARPPHRSARDLPGHAPIAWHETTRRTPSRLPQLFKLAATLCLPLVFILWLCIAVSGGNYAFVPRVATVFAWGLAAAVIVTKGASLLGADRANGTLDVLMTTPIRSSEIVSQRAAGLRRFVPVLALPICISHLARLWQGSLAEYSSGGGPTYLTAALLSVVVFLPLLYWLGLAIGLWVQSRSRAVLVGTSLVASWAILPLLVQGALVEVGVRWLLPYVGLLSPAAVLFYADRSFAARRAVDVPGGGLVIVASFAAFGLLALVLRLFVSWSTPRCLGRVEAPRHIAEAPGRPRGKRIPQTEERND
jgi:ABC-type transport system involved in multi-copper enzyme maturation permease subunit